MNPIKGTTEDCLAHFAKAIEGDDFFAKRRVIAEFTGVLQTTVHRWFKGILPVGESLLRLRFYMEFLGYDVVELHKLHDPVRKTARLFAFGLVTLSEVADLVECTGKKPAHQLLNILQGNQNVSPERLGLFKDLVGLYEELLPAKQKTVEKVISYSGVTKIAPLPAQVQESEPHVTTPIPTRIGRHQTPSEHQAIIEALAGSIRALVPLADLVSSDSFSEEDRAKVRELSGGNGVFILANRLYRICGERARKIHSDQ